jgi:hypothetical protein
VPTGHICAVTFWTPSPKERIRFAKPGSGAQYCTKLFEYERISKEKKHTYEERKEYRLLMEKPILDTIWEWLSEQKLTKGSRFDKAVNYAIRPFAVGRRNWLFSDTPNGAAASATIYPMIEMAKANNLNQYKYLLYLLQHRPNAKMTDAELDQFAPWNEDVIMNCRNI